MLGVAISSRRNTCKWCRPESKGKSPFLSFARSGITLRNEDQLWYVCTGRHTTRNRCGHSWRWIFFPLLVIFFLDPILPWGCRDCGILSDSHDLRLDTYGIRSESFCKSSCFLDWTIAGLCRSYSVDIPSTKHAFLNVHQLFSYKNLQLKWTMLGARSRNGCLEDCHDSTLRMVL